MIKRVVIISIVIFIVSLIYNVQNTIVYQIHGRYAYPILAREWYGIVTCPKLFKDNSCAGSWHTLGTHDNEAKK